MDYEEIKQKAIEVEGAVKMYQYAVQSGNEEKAAEYVQTMWNLSSDLIRQSESLAACVVFTRASSLAFEYYLERKSPLFVAAIANMICQRMAPILNSAPDNEPAQSILLQSAAQLLKGLDTFVGERVSESDDDEEVEILLNTLQAAIQVCDEVINRLKDINPENPKLQLFYPFVEDMKEDMLEHGADPEVAAMSLPECLEFVDSVLEIYTE